MENKSQELFELHLKCINAYNEYEKCRKACQQAQLEARQQEFSKLSEPEAKLVASEHFAVILVRIFLQTGFIKQQGPLYIFQDSNEKEIRILGMNRLIEYLYLHQEETSNCFLKNLSFRKEIHNVAPNL